MRSVDQSIMLLAKEYSFRREVRAKRLKSYHGLVGMKKQKSVFAANAAGLSLTEVHKELDRSTVSGLDFPSFRMALITKVIERMSVRYFADASEFNAAEWRVLCRICDSEDMTVGQIADRAMVDRAEVSRAASALESRGFLARKENPSDRRMPILHATDAGRASYEPLLKSRRDFHQSILANVSPLERDLLDALLLKISNRLLEMASDQPAD